jgi:hypothetical protein
MNNMPYVLYRPSILTNKELTAIRKVVPFSNSDLPETLHEGSIVFPRFRSIPYGEMLAEQVTNAGGLLVNSWEQYQYVSDVNAWKDDLKGLTPAVYSETDIPDLPEGEWFVKGETNSDKENWATSCYAKNLDSLSEVVNNLHNHPVVGNQKLVVRPFIHYRTLGVMENGQPICNEWRVFVLYNQIVATGFYWSSRINMIDSRPESPLKNKDFQHTIQTAIQRLGNKVPYVVIDLAERTDGSWDIIELNDGNMSGLCDINPLVLWQNITDVLKIKN